MAMDRMSVTADDSGWANGAYTDVDEIYEDSINGVPSTDTSFIGPAKTTEGKNTIMVLDLENPADFVDADTEYKVYFRFRAKTDGAGNDSLRITFNGANQQVTLDSTIREFGAVFPSPSWTEAQWDAAQVSFTALQGGMPSAVGHEVYVIDAFLVYEATTSLTRFAHGESLYCEKQTFTSATGVTITLPKTATDGNLLIAYIQAVAQNESITLPTGFTLLGEWDNLNSGDPYQGAWCYKVAVGNETTVAFTWNTDPSTLTGSAHCAEYVWDDSTPTVQHVEDETNIDTAFAGGLGPAVTPDTAQNILIGFVSALDGRDAHGPVGGTGAPGQLNYLGTGPDNVWPAIDFLFSAVDQDAGSGLDGILMSVPDATTVSHAFHQEAGSDADTSASTTKRYEAIACFNKPAVGSLPVPPTQKRTMNALLQL